jgi:hypothetical protein
MSLAISSIRTVGGVPLENLKLIQSTETIIQLRLPKFP